jgi:hypothetical protein
VGPTGNEDVGHTTLMARDMLYSARDDDGNSTRNEGGRDQRESSRDDETGMESDEREIDKGEAHFLEERSKYDTIGLELIFFVRGGFLNYNCSVRPTQDPIFRA